MQCIYIKCNSDVYIPFIIALIPSKQLRVKMINKSKDDKCFLQTQKHFRKYKKKYLDIKNNKEKSDLSSMFVQEEAQ